LKQHVVYFPKIGGMTTADKPLDGNVAVMVGLMFASAKVKRFLHQTNFKDFT
jgi:hypothetical protein